MLPFYEYSIYLTIVNKQIEEANAKIQAEEADLLNLPGRIS